MKVLCANTHDISGGAAIATRRIHLGLREIGVDSTFLALWKLGNGSHVKGASDGLARMWATIRHQLDALPLRRYPQRIKTLFSPSGLSYDLVRALRENPADVLNLFWVEQGFLSIESLKDVKIPIVWTLHDMWPMTGGCHYDYECGRFRIGCGKCPQLGSVKQDDLSRRIFLRKQRSWKNCNLTGVATSRWMADCMAESPFFKDRRIVVIPNGFDTDVYKPIDKMVARDLFGLPRDGLVILMSASFAASDPRKGIQHLIPALREIAESPLGSICTVAILGSTAMPDVDIGGLRINCLGHLSDEVSQVALYSAADVLVAPSIQENLANTVIEAMLCGTPVTAFGIGGMLDSIEHMVDGYCARPFDPADLAAGIKWILENPERTALLSSAARKNAVAKYSLGIISERYADLYRSLL